ncbi:aldehyde dehydrogenase family protein [Metamycoplasma neophronis]|uniref:Aldehyde dehydrogenase n=1 Tax=Metamycoplasma neophronis TaxID=872983 RepID=A0ABY2YZB2_9BACT|nr:aldehyde dehydrogenase family protein [Metamycoplasma neophronis]TPR53371.1 aldehyde dehydrogenase family protein [Metamycoplasma neophronis]
MEKISIKERIYYLKALKKWIISNREAIYDALYQDLNKSKVESEMTEISAVIKEIITYIKKIKSWDKIKRVRGSLELINTKFYTQPLAYGKVLIISPWNYPFNLSLIPFIDAFGAGNTVYLKPSEFSHHTSQLLTKMAKEVFPEDLLSVHLGDKNTVNELLEKNIDFIFFTGNNYVGKIIYQAAANKMIPCVLELGGKSPTIVDPSANLEVAAKRIVFGKLMNGGQTCVAPDYIYVHKDVKLTLVKLIRERYHEIYGKNPLENDALPKIISDRHLERIKNYHLPIEYNETRQMNLLIKESNWDAPEMQEEIFAPILPILEYENLEKVVDEINQHDIPLALYIFSQNKHNINYLLSAIKSGTAAINDTVIQIANNNFGFGGLGKSGIGKYHGKTGFDTFTSKRNIAKTGRIFDIPLKYKFATNEAKKLKLIKALLKSK